MQYPAKVDFLVQELINLMSAGVAHPTTSCNYSLSYSVVVVLGMCELGGRTGPPKRKGPLKKNHRVNCEKKIYINLNHINKIMEVSISSEIPVTKL